MQKFMRATLLSVHNRLLPKNAELGFMPYIWLSYLAFYFIAFFVLPISALMVMAATVTIPLFLVLYFITYWVKPKAAVWCIFAIFTLGIVQIHINPGANVFLIYASSFCFHTGAPKRAFACLLTLILTTVGYAFLSDFSTSYLAFTLFFMLLIGGSNIYFVEVQSKDKALKLSQQQIQALAQTAERERIARDLHDLIGHTFSMITMKSQLARKLIDHDIDKARYEIKQLEDISRDALSQVREAVTGYRQKDLLSEVNQAQALLQAADINCRTNFNNAELEQLNGQITVSLGFALRELVNNVVKHSDASACSIDIAYKQHELTLQVHDDGDVKALKEGNGLQGIRERISQLNGELEMRMENGLVVCIQVPL